MRKFVFFITIVVIFSFFSIKTYAETDVDEYISEFESIRNSGKICISLRNNDELIGVKKSTGEDYVMMASTEGRMCLFNENEIRVMGRTASGVRGINLNDSDCVRR